MSVRWSFDISTLYQQDSDPPDPAFWSSFRYPAINSSLAIGKDGIATATSGGLILWIDYLYYTEGPRPKGINVSPVDDYIGQLEDGERLCYISPSGRTAETVLQRSGSTLPVYPAEVICLTLLQKNTYGRHQTRSFFAALPENLTITASDAAKISWRQSADQTQLYIDPIAQPAVSRTLTISGNGRTLAEFVVDYRTLPSPLSQSDLLAQKLVVQQSSFFSPFIVPALDQLGLATITIPFRVVDFLDAKSGRLWAYGYESYNAADAGSPTRAISCTSSTAAIATAT